MRLTGGQYLPSRRLAERVGGLLAGVGAVPVGDEDVLGGVRGVGEGAVVVGDLAALDLGDLLADGEHGVDEPVELGERLGLGRLDHERAGDREAHRRGVEAEVDEPLGDVVDGDAGGLR